jgi:ferredoxin
MLIIDSDLCGQCGGCVAVCPTGALELYSNSLKIKYALCTLCENCVTFCPVSALMMKTEDPEAFSFSKTKLSDLKNE